MDLIHILDLQQCPHCGINHPLLVEKASFRTDSFDGQEVRLWSAYACTKCGLVTTAYAYSPEGAVEEIFPSVDEINIAVPARAKSYLEQARNSLHAPSGAIMLSASSIDAMLKEKGYREGNLYNRINTAAKDHLITESMALWAHQIRLDANDERHADDNYEMPDQQDAQRVIEFAKALAEYLFILPSRVSRALNATKAQ